MWRHMAAAMATVAVVVFLVSSAPCQESSATVRTYQGVSYKVADLSLEVYYTIGEPKEATSQEATQGFLPTINITTGMSSSAGGGEQPAAAGEKEAPLLRGHSRVSDITVSSQGAETRIALDQIRAIRFARTPVTVAGLQLPPYVPYYKYSASVSLTGGAQLEADYVNLGATIVRGAGQNGRIDIPWGEVESIIFER